MLFSHGTFGSKGVCVAFRYNLEYDGRYDIVCVEIQGQPYILINCYAHNTKKAQIEKFMEIASYLAEMDIPPDSKCVCAGDWNLIFDATMDSSSKKAKLKRKVPKL